MSFFLILFTACEIMASCPVCVSPIIFLARSALKFLLI